MFQSDILFQRFNFIKTNTTDTTDDKDHLEQALIDTLPILPQHSLKDFEQVLFEGVNKCYARSFRDFIPKEYILLYVCDMLGTDLCFQADWEFKKALRELDRDIKKAKIEFPNDPLYKFGGVLSYIQVTKDMLDPFKSFETYSEWYGDEVSKARYTDAKTLAFNNFIALKEIINTKLSHLGSELVMR